MKRHPGFNRNNGPEDKVVYLPQYYLSFPLKKLTLLLNLHENQVLIALSL